MPSKRWILAGICLLCLLILMSCRLGPMGAVPAQPASAPLLGTGRGPALPIPWDVPSSPSASPSPLTQIPFPFPPGPKARLCVYDRPRQEVFVYPGSGPEVRNAFTLNPGQYYFDDGRNIYLFDAWREQQIKLVDGKEVGGFAFLASFANNYQLYFLGQSDPWLAARGIGFAYEKRDGAATPSAVASPSFDVTRYATLSSAPSITIPPPDDISAYLAKPIFLSKINAVAVLHGGVTSISVDGGDTAVAFTTGDGGLYLYLPRQPQVVALLSDEVIQGGFHASFANIDPIWGRFVVWQDLKARRLYTLDRWTGQIDSMPYAKLALNAVAASAPSFYENDPYEVVFTLTLSDGTTRFVSYHLLTEGVLNLTLLNAFTALLAPFCLHDPGGHR